MPRKLVYYVACTLDGFIAREDGSFDWFLSEGEHFPFLIERFPETFPAHLRLALGIPEEARRFDTVLMGRRTYEVGLRAGITNPYAPLRQFIVSRTMMESPDPAVELCRGEALEEHAPEGPVAGRGGLCALELVRGLKAEGGGKDIWLCGGSKLAGAVFPEIDEVILKINPVLIGVGIPLFEGVAAGTRAATSLLGYETFSNGFVVASYSLGSSR